jgi:hypothetical protein
MGNKVILYFTKMPLIIPPEPGNAVKIPFFQYPYPLETELPQI